MPSIKWRTGPGLIIWPGWLINIKDRKAGRVRCLQSNEEQDLASYDLADISILRTRRHEDFDAFNGLIIWPGRHINITRQTNLGWSNTLSSSSPPSGKNVWSVVWFEGRRSSTSFNFVTCSTLRISSSQIFAASIAAYNTDFWEETKEDMYPPGNPKPTYGWIVLGGRLDGDTYK